MAFKYPPTSSKIRGHMTPDVIDGLARWRELPTRLEASARAKNFCRTSGTGATGVYTLCLLADDAVALCYFGVRGGFRELWNFGKASL